jgi:hypothetical protein
LAGPCHTFRSMRAAFQIRWLQLCDYSVILI